MMKAIQFTKMVASGNDFVVMQSHKSPFGFAQGRQVTSHKLLAKKICDRKFGAGADGLLILEKTNKADIKMRIFNADGSEAEMCGNGARCAALYLSRKSQVVSHKLKIETKAGVIEAEVKNDKVKIKLTDPRDVKLGIPIKVGGRRIKVNFINTGVPHAVVFVEGLNKIDVVTLGREVRRHKQFAPAGTNVDFVEAVGNASIKVRTYERGVEDETLACGTGAVASALITICHLPFAPAVGRSAFGGNRGLMNVHTQGGEILKVYFQRAGNAFTNVWLEGKARKVYTGVWDV